MPEAVIVSAVRTPVGRAYKGSLRATRPDDLGFWHGGTSQVEIQCSLLGECGEKATMRCRDLIRVRLFMEEVRLRMTSYLPSIYLSLRAVPLRGMKMVPGGSTLNFFE